jgi:ATP-binding cassette subfamily C protein CydD
MKYSSPARQQARWMTGLRRHGGLALAVAAILPLIGGILLVAQAWLLADILHQSIVAGAARTGLTLPVAVLAALLALRILLGLAAERAAVEGAERVKAVVRHGLFRRILAEQPAWTAARPSGALSSVLVDQVEALDGFFARFFPAMVQAAVLPVAFAVLVLPVDWVVGLLFLVTAPLIPLFMALVGWGAEAATRANAEAFSRLSGLFADRLRGMLTLKLFGRAAAETETVRQGSDRLRQRTLGVLRIAFLSSAVLEFFAALGVAGVALYVGLTYLGMVELRGSPLTLQAGLFCLLMAPEVYQPLRLLAAHYHDRAAAKAAVAEIAAQFEELPALAPAVPEPATVPNNGRALGLDIRDLTLRTPDRQRTILDAAQLTVAPGSHVAILGESGVGKTSFLEAIGRLRDAKGEILIGGRRLAGLPEAELRATVAMLGQRPRLFHGTIADNIRLGRRDASDQDVRQAAERALVTGFAPDLDAPLGENGLGLSGGEAHRVALARIFLRDPGLLLLDEPTAHLDDTTARLLLDNLLAFAQGRTLIVATHAAAVAARMDRSYRIAGGRLLPAPHRREPDPRQPIGNVA